MLKTIRKKADNDEFFRLLIAFVLVLIIGGAFYYMGNRQVGRESGTADVGLDGFEPEYLSSTENIEIPGDIPIGLLSGPRMKIESGSYLIQKSTGSEKYTYTVRASGTKDEVFQEALDVMQDADFSILEEDFLGGDIVATKESLLIIYSVLDTGERGLIVNILYQNVGPLPNQQ